MTTSVIKVSMTSFADFVTSDPMGQAAKLRELKRQYQGDYRPSEDFWSRWREGVESVHRSGGGKQALGQIAANAKDNRQAQFESACTGYAKFWGRRDIEIVRSMNPRVWRWDRLEVKVNPEWMLRLSGRTLVVKLHLKERLKLNQRLANPLLYLLEQEHSDAGADGYAILDVHRGKLFEAKTLPPDLAAVVRMQASAFIAGWLEVFGDAAA